MSKGNTLIVVLGPTGVGKTKVSLCLADVLNTAVINADSRQVFAEIPIGTAAPTREEMERVKHYFVGTHSVHDYYSASQFEQDVLSLLNRLFKDSNTALMSGGSMMYIDAVCNGIDDIPTVDDHTRANLRQRLADEGLEALVEELREKDPEHWNIVDRNNPRRVVHALEIIHMTGRTYTSFRTNVRRYRPFNIVKIGLNLPREELYEGINKRVDQMIENGLVEEARRQICNRHENALNTVGYKEMFRYFDGECTFGEAVEQIKSNTRRYCRKQLTWFRRDESINWFHPDDLDGIIGYIRLRTGADKDGD